MVTTLGDGTGVLRNRSKIRVLFVFTLLSRGPCFGDVILPRLRFYLVCFAQESDFVIGS